LKKYSNSKENVMKKIPSQRVAICAVLLVFCVSANAQKGTGEPSGIVREAAMPAVNTFTGKVLEIESGPCEKTTGRSSIGTHLLVQDDDTQLNIHLGPEKAVDHVVDQIAKGSSVTFDVFRTERMPKNAYIAKSLTLDDKVIHLRDANLRPSWSYGRGNARGRGYGFGPGRGLRGPCW
jgi:hypothetical protein